MTVSCFVIPCVETRSVGRSCIPSNYNRIFVQSAIGVQMLPRRGRSLPCRCMKFEENRDNAWCPCCRMRCVPVFTIISTFPTCVQEANAMLTRAVSLQTRLCIVRRLATSVEISEKRAPSLCWIADIAERNAEVIFVRPLSLIVRLPRAWNLLFTSHTIRAEAEI